MFDEITIVEAEAVAGRRLDRRRKYALLDGELCELARYSVNCSGCSCACSDGYPCCHGGCGCRECGGSGKRRMREWFPVRYAEISRAIAKGAA